VLIAYKTLKQHDEVTQRYFHITPLPVRSIELS
jgi:hypothetical protein